MARPKDEQGKTCVIVIARHGTGQENLSGGFTYVGQPLKQSVPPESCRYLEVWETATGDMVDTKTGILKTKEEARDLPRHDPLTPQQAIDLLSRNRSRQVLCGVGSMVPIESLKG